MKPVGVVLASLSAGSSRRLHHPLFQGVVDHNPLDHTLLRCKGFRWEDGSIFNACPSSLPGSSTTVAVIMGSRGPYRPQTYQELDFFHFIRWGNIRRSGTNADGRGLEVGRLVFCINSPHQGYSHFTHAAQMSGLPLRPIQLSRPIDGDPAPESTHASRHLSDALLEMWYCVLPYPVTSMQIQDDPGALQPHLIWIQKPDFTSHYPPE